MTLWHDMIRLATIGVLLFAAASGGCAKSAGVIFPPIKNAPAWPGPPDPARIRYVGQLATSADLKPAIPFFDALGQTIFGKPSTHSLLAPYALCTDGKSRLFVADSNAQLVHVFDLTTRKYQQWRPQGRQQRFTQPVGITYDPAGRLFVADSVGASLHVFAADGKYLGPLAQNLVKRPCGLAFDSRRQLLFVADASIHEVLILTPGGTEVSRLGGRGTALGRFNYPTNVAVDSQGRLYVSDSLNFRVQQFSADFKTARQISRQGDSPGYSATPKGLALDGDDHLYVVDAKFETVQIFDGEGQILLNFGQEGSRPGEFWLPAGIFIDPHNRIWVADQYNRRVQVFDYLPEKKP